MNLRSRRIAQNMNEKIWKILPGDLGQNFSKIFVHILGNAATSYIHSEISWPLEVFRSDGAYWFARFGPYAAFTLLQNMIFSETYEND